MKLIDQLIKWIGEKTSYLNFVLILLIVVDVLLRYLFSNTQNWVLELEWHLFAMLFLIGASYAMQTDAHVRVDVFHQHLSPKSKALVECLGIVIFLIPWVVLVICTSYNYAYNSYSFNEGSPNPGGLPYRWIIKFMIVVGFSLLLIQAISLLSQNLRKLVQQ